MLCCLKCSELDGYGSGGGGGGTEHTRTYNRLGLFIEELGQQQW